MKAAERRALFGRVLREVPCMLDRLSDEDKARLAATCWSVLEAVLRGCRAVLKVSRSDPVLQVLARRMEEGPCHGSLKGGTMQVLATDAGQLLAAMEKVDEAFVDVHDDGNGADDEATEVAKWYNCAWLLGSGARDEDAARVTGLVAPQWARVPPYVTTDVVTVSQILSSSGVRQHLRSLQISLVFRESPLVERLEWSLLDAMCGLSALRHLDIEVAARPVEDLVRVISTCSSLTSLTLSQAKFDFEQTRVFLDGLDRASHLRRLRLREVRFRHRRASSASESSCSEDDDDDEVRPPPSHLEAIEVDRSDRPYCWQDATNLHVLDVRDEGAGERSMSCWEDVADLIRRSRALRRVKLSCDHTIAEEGLCAVVSALEQSTVEVLSCTWLARAQTKAPLTQAVVAAVKANTSLRELELVWDTFSEPNDCVDWAAVAQALRGNTTLRVLRIADREMGDASAAAFADILRADTLEEFCLQAHTTISPKGIATMSRGLTLNARLQVLRMDMCPELCSSEQEAADCMERLVDALFCGRRCNKDPLRDGWLLGGAVRCGLRTLEICDLSMGDEGARHIAAGLSSEMCVLRELVLRNVNIGDSGVTHIARALASDRCPLVSLEITSLRLTDRGRESLAKALIKNTTLRRLNLATIVERVVPEVWPTTGFRYVDKTVEWTPLAEQLLDAQKYAAARRLVDVGHGRGDLAPQD
ncbi:unnamed protein product [Pedinophyceae sp. YPF-701]|nr:unnamed protein product [Pedinophyceae sp. YPF-701]